MHAVAPSTSFEETLKCCACGHEHLVICERHEAFDRACPSCQARGDFEIVRPQVLQDHEKFAPERRWRGPESTSLEFPLVPPQNLAGWKKDIPSLETNSRGEVVFHSDKHQRQVYREMAASRRRRAEAGE